MTMNKTEQKNIYVEICRGNPAHGLYWNLESLDTSHPSEESAFYEKAGRKFLKSGSYIHKWSRQKDRPKPWLVTEYKTIEYLETEDGDDDVFTWTTAMGALTARRYQNHFIEYPVKTVADIAVWNYIHRNMIHRINEKTEKLTPEIKKETRIICVNWSPVQQLLQFDIGLENFYYFLADAPAAMEELMETMHAINMLKLHMALDCFPNAPVVYWGENTSSSSISPDYYTRYTLKHIRDYADMAHKSNRRLIVHMCGLLKSLLDCFVLTGMDGIHSVTPPPFGDTPYAMVRKKFGPDFTIIGRFNAQLWVGRSKEEIIKNIRQAIYPQLLDTPFALLITSDAIPDIPCENVMTLIDALDTI